MKRRSLRRKVLDELAFRYGFQPWMICVLLLMLIFVVALIYFVSGGNSWTVPTPRHVEVPAPP
jgi:hypothetical protein